MSVCAARQRNEFSSRSEVRHSVKYMPGIVGIVRKHAYEGIDQDLQVMIDSIRHEPSYVGGRYVNRESAVAVGWLSHEGTLGASMPIMTRDKRRVLIIVGEHFSGNCRSGVSQKEGVAAVLSELAQGFEGPEAAFLKSLNGWFAGIIIDLDRMAVTLFNDRYGMSRVYFHESEGEFLFGSEAKALLRIRPKLRKVEPKSVAEYLRFNCVMGNRTLFSDIGLLPVASSWRFAGSVIPQRSNYFEYSEWEQQSLLRPVEFQGEFDSTVSRIFPYYMGGSDRVGFSLTAGLDTRAILASAKSEGQGGPCYTFGGLWGETFDIRTARKLAEVCHLSHQTIRIDEAFLQQFSDYADKSVYISDGTHDALGAHDVYFNQVARKIAPIRMTGKFGSEVVRIRRLIPSWESPGSFFSRVLLRC